MADTKLPLAEFLSSYDRSVDKAGVDAAEDERRQIVDLFPLDQWPTLPLERYALGQDGVVDTFSKWLEFGAPNLGSMRGGSAQKHFIYRQKESGTWFFPPAYPDVASAWEGIRKGFVDAFRLAKIDAWGELGALPFFRGGPITLLKTLHVYFPDALVPIYAQDNIRYFLRHLGRPEADDRSVEIVQLARALRDAIRGMPQFKGWSTVEVMHCLYRWSNPNSVRQVVKIAPGEDAKYWGDCLSQGYICVGWDDVGDLREFATKEQFKARFAELYATRYQGNQSTLSKKANDLWKLTQLEPGDLVVANQGTSKVLAIGEVAEPYSWAQSREHYRHIVNVKWDTSVAKEIPAQKKWAMTTVADVPIALYELIVDGVRAKHVTIESVDPTHRQIAAALERKGQAILYGPPGTGKTFHARRFAVTWLLTHSGRESEVGAVLKDAATFNAVEEQLSTSRVSRRLWWAVANPKEWSWDRLFKDKTVRFRHGRVHRNYQHVKAGDLVVGYQSTPDKRIVALSRVLKPVVGSDGNIEVELELVAPIKDGLTYDELVADAVLKSSEPMRLRNQGTLFALTEFEADHLLERLSERNAELLDHVSFDESVGALTRLTFHPSYSYEDFVEGFRPVETSDRSLSLRLTDGTFKRVCDAAAKEPKKRFLVLIDEINRANLAKVFGELITLLEVDKRGMTVTLPQSRESFSIPPNVFLLGTMNTSDKSIKLLDAALRRRFAFIELMPDVDVFDDREIGALSLASFLRGLNERIAKIEGREKQIGHSFLMRGNAAISEPEEFAHHFREDILPLLQEFCYDDYGALAQFVGKRLVNVEAHTLNHELLADSAALLDTLAAEFAERKEP